MDYYPKWKTVLYRFIRIFLISFLFIAVPKLSSLPMYPTWQDVYEILLYPALIGGVAAVGKALRIYIGGDDYDKKIHKIPF